MPWARREFEDDPSFSKSWVLQTSDAPAVVRAFCSPRLREGLAHMLDRDLILEARGEILVVHRARKLEVGEVELLVADAINLFRCWS